jgi:hypothetical protein
MTQNGLEDADLFVAVCADFPPMQALSMYGVRSQGYRPDSGRRPHGPFLLDGAACPLSSAKFVEMTSSWSAPTSTQDGFGFFRTSTRYTGVPPGPSAPRKNPIAARLTKPVTRSSIGIWRSNN